MFDPQTAVNSAGASGSTWCDQNYIAVESFAVAALSPASRGEAGKMTRLRAADAERRAASDYTAEFSEALARGITIIKSFTAERRQMTLADAARAADLPRATTRRALYTLAYLGYVETEGRLFRLTPKVLELASAYLVASPVSSVLQPVCERLAAALGATCSVAVWDGGEVVMVARASPAQPAMTVGMGIGLRLPALASALGRVLLSNMPVERLDALLAERPPAAVTPYTITDPKKVRAAIFAAKRDNYALVDQEAELGYRSLSVPLRRYDGAAIAAMNVGAKIEQMSCEDMLAKCLPMLRAEAEAISGQLI
jgi:IclR family pca regulon transcriptional regulator